MPNPTNTSAPTMTKSELTSLLYQYNDQVARALGVDEETSRRFVASFIIAAQKNPKILQCTKGSIAACMLNAAQINIMPDTPQELAYLIPYKNVLTSQLSYRGWRELAYRSNAVQRFSAEVVFQGDDFHFQYGTGAHLSHTPRFTGSRTSDRATHVYAVAELANGGTPFLVMSKQDVDDIANATSPSVRGGKDSPWKHELWWAEMAKKTVIKRFSNELPQTEGLAQLMAAKKVSDLYDQGIIQEIVKGEVIERNIEKEEKLDEFKAEELERQHREAIARAQIAIGGKK